MLGPHDDPTLSTQKLGDVVSGSTRYDWRRQGNADHRRRALRVQLCRKGIWDDKHDLPYELD